MFRYCIQIKILTSSIRIRNSVCTCLDGFKAGSELFRFPAWVQFFVSGVTCSARAPSVVLVWRLEMAAWRHRGKLSSATVGFVAPLRLWHSLRPPPQPLDSWLRYGFGTALDPLRWLVWLWESSGPASRSALRAFERAEFRSARELQEGREEREDADAPRLFNCPVWTPPTGGWSNQIVRMGRSSTHVHGFLARHFQWRKE